MTVPHQAYCVFSRRPLVVFIRSPWDADHRDFLDSPEPVAILAASECFPHPAMYDAACRWADSHLRRNHNHRIEFLCHSREEADTFSGRGHYATLSHQNSLADERLFRPMQSVDKGYDSIYVGRPHPQKNLHLCSGIRAPWLWIFYLPHLHPEILQETLAYPHVVAPQWRHGKFAGYIPPHNLVPIINSARVGLCLSEREGAMWAAVEYQLCGLPIVSVPTLSARTLLYDDSAVFVVDPTPEAVAEGIERAIASGKGDDYSAIRRTVLEKMKPHRAAFVEAVRRAYKHVGISRDAAFDLRHLRRHRMLWWQPLPQLRDGGDNENRSMLQVAEAERPTERLWAGLEPQFWERPAPAPA